MKTFYRQCRNWKCNEFFEAKPLEFKFYCERCFEKNETIENLKFFVAKVKNSRGIKARNFDLYDLALKTDFGYERVCRVCGNRLVNKDGSYSPSRRYCSEHNGEAIYRKYNWNYCKELYAEMVQANQKEEIKEKIMKLLEENRLGEKYDDDDLFFDFILCERCKKLIRIKGSKFNNFELMNVHHKIPVHSLTYNTLYLIFDFKNLICLCEECHNYYHRSRKVDNKLGIRANFNFKSIEEYL